MSLLHVHERRQERREGKSAAIGYQHLDIAQHTGCKPGERGRRCGPKRRCSRDRCCQCSWTELDVRLQRRRNKCRRDGRAPVQVAPLSRQRYGLVDGPEREGCSHVTPFETACFG